MASNDVEAFIDNMSGGGVPERIPLSDEQIEAFMEVVRAKQKAYYDRMGYTGRMEPPVITAESGPKYIRIVESRTDSQRSVYCFLNRTNGDILKSASWKAPAKHARGNVNTPGYQTCLTEYGAAYLR
jgi:hypothetical protein